MQDWKPLVIDRLSMLGLSVVVDSAVDFTMGKAREDILNFCNIDELPEGIKYTYVERCVAEYLYSMISTNQISNEQFHNALTSITEGDVSYSYATPDGFAVDINSWIKDYRELQKPSLLRFRRLPRVGRKSK